MYDMMQSSWAHIAAQIAIIVPAFLISVSFHEFCHALTAYLLGDSTAKRSGRLTLNPLAHIDPLGVLFLIVFRFGWANPVPINQNNFKYPRIYSILSAFAGPISNFFLAIFALLIVKYIALITLPITLEATSTQFFSALASINVMLGIFNLLPIPPLDGSHVITALLSKRFPQVVVFLHRYSLFILLGILMFPQTQHLLFTLMKTADQILKSYIF